MNIFGKIIAFTACLLMLISTSVFGMDGDTKPLATEPFRRQILPNGQTFIIYPQSTAKSVFTDVYYRTGSAYEYDSINGISLAITKIIDNRIRTILSQTGGKEISYYSSVQPDQVTFSFQSDASQLNFVLELIKDKICFFKTDSPSVNKAISEIKVDIDSINRLPDAALTKSISQKLWGRDYPKLSSYGNQQGYLKLTPAVVNLFHHKYFLPTNNAISIIGNIGTESTLPKVEADFKEYFSTEFNPEQIIKVLEFKPIVNFSQLLFDKDTGDNEATIRYQNPGTRIDRSASYAAFLLSNILNDKNGRFQKEIATLAGFKEFNVSYEPTNFNATFRLSLKSSSSNFIDQFNYINNLITNLCKKEYLKDGELEVAKKNIEIEFNDLKEKTPHLYLNQIGRYRFLNDEKYFMGLSDSIQRVSLDDMQSYMGNYFSNYAGVRSLRANEDALKSAADNQKFYPLDESVEDMKFTYELNKTDVEGTDNLLNEERLLRWLQINPDIHVQINGFADEAEFDRANDKNVMDFVDSIPTFKKVKPDLVKKGYFKLEMMRALKIVKYLYEHGITEDRVTGTCMVFTSDTKEQEVENRKCTVTLDKRKSRLSLYEYHLGDKKER